MKQSFFLYFLVFSPLLFGQNSFRSHGEPNNVAPLERDYLSKFKNQQIVVLNKNLNVKDYSWLRNVSDSVDSQTTISSLELIEQLNTLDHQTPFKLQHNPTLERFIRVFLKNRQEQLAEIMGKSKYYFPLFEQYLDQYNLPLELKYLAIVESALQPTANSHVGAKGLWQFMYGTGKQYGLEINTYVDERLDPVKSTQAACAYLSELYQRFGHWDLALAAYNSGPGNVSRAIKKAGGDTNYWSIRSYLPQETRGYLPAFYATYYIFEHANDLGMTSKKSDISYFEIERIKVEKPLNFNTLTNLIGIQPETLAALNPQYKKGYIPSTPNKTYTLALPTGLIDAYLNLDDIVFDNNQHYAHIPITPHNSYVVKEGDNFLKIAQKHGISKEQLKQWNGLQTDFLIKDQRLVVTNKKNLHNSKASKPKTNLVKQESNYKLYTVKEGDTLFRISRKFANISIDQIRQWNNIWDVNYLKPGMQLRIY